MLRNEIYKNLVIDYVYINLKCLWRKTMGMLSMKVEKMNKKAVIPTRGTANSAGLDLTAIDYEIKNNGKDGIVVFKTGLKVEIPPGHFGGIYIRSGIASKGNWTLANGCGIIDSDYRGELMVMFRYVSGGRFFQRLTDFTPMIKELMGQRIAQLIIQPYTNVALCAGTVNSTDRGSGGMGSTGV